MQLSAWLKSAAAQLTNVGVGSSQLDALILLEDELGKDRAHLLAYPEIELLPAQLKNLDVKLKRRLKHEPMAYIRGFSEFYGRNFLIDKRVLEPRVESEVMIELLLKEQLPSQPVIADIGTGSGAIAITTKLELPNAVVIATEIDANALEVAKQNAKTHQAKIEMALGNLLEPLDRVDIILANLPYVPDKWQINEAAAMEPRIAIFGGADGLDLYRKMFDQIKAASWQPRLVYTESLPPQHSQLAQVAKAAKYNLIASQDFIQVFTTD